jgi:hypothetical protein
MQLHRIDEVVHVDEPCCAGGTHTVVYTDVFGWNHHLIHREINCARCGTVSAADGGELPSNVRTALIAAHGEWEVRSLPGARLRVLAAIRNFLGLSLDDARKRIRSDEPMFRGSHAEANDFSARLIERGVLDADLSVQRRL